VTCAQPIITIQPNLLNCHWELLWSKFWLLKEYTDIQAHAVWHIEIGSVSYHTCTSVNNIPTACSAVYHPDSTRACMSRNPSHVERCFRRLLASCKLAVGCHAPGCNSNWHLVWCSEISDIGSGNLSTWCLTRACLCRIISKSTAWGAVETRVSGEHRAASAARLYI